MASFEIMLKVALEEITMQIQANSDRITDVDAKLAQTAKLLMDDMTAKQLRVRNAEQANQQEITRLTEKIVTLETAAIDLRRNLNQSLERIKSANTLQATAGPSSGVSEPRLHSVEDAMEKAENYTRRECTILQFLPPLYENQSLTDQITSLTQILYPEWNPQISWEAVHYLGPVRDPNRPPPAILKVSFRMEKEDFFGRFIRNEGDAFKNSVFFNVRISNSLSKISLLRRSLLLSHHIYLRNQGEPSQLRETSLRLHDVTYTVDYRTCILSPEPPWPTRDFLSQGQECHSTLHLNSQEESSNLVSSYDNRQALDAMPPN